MRLYLTSLFAFVLAFCTFTESVNADLLCVKNKVRLSASGKINLGRSITKVADSACPTGTTFIANLAGLLNETGELPKVATNKLLTGTFGIGGTAVGASEYGASAISFPANFDGTLTAEVVEQGNPATTNCPGTPDAPDAAAGYLCIYVSFADQVSNHKVWDPLTSSEGTCSPMGASVYAYASAGGAFYSWGTWAARSGGLI